MRHRRAAELIDRRPAMGEIGHHLRLPAERRYALRGYTMITGKDQHEGELRQGLQCLPARHPDGNVQVCRANLQVNC